MVTKGTCAICGKRPATTVDHLPPKGIFPKPRPSDLITVPACLRCNQMASKDDEKFRVYLSMQIGIDTPKTKALWDIHAFRSVKHNRQLHREIVSTMKPVELTTRSGIVIGRRTGVLWDSNSHDSVIERTIRGLYYHHYDEILGDKTKVKVQWLRHLDRNLYEQSKNWPQNDIGDGALIYKYGRVEGAPLNSIWIFQFYGRHWSLGYTEPVSTAQSVIAAT